MFYNYVFFAEEERKYTPDRKLMSETRRKYYSLNPSLERTMRQNKNEVFKERDDQGNYIARRRMTKAGAGKPFR